MYASNTLGMHSFQCTGETDENIIHRL